MWKPGTADPRRVESGPSQRNIFDGDIDNRRNGGSAKPRVYTPTGSKINGSGRGSANVPAAKKLSGATLNMRFMQRKAETEAASERKRRTEEKMEVEVVGHTTTNNGSSNFLTSSGDSGGNSAVNYEQNRGELQESLIEASHQLPTHIATDVDMYGVEADIIGRRSFGGYNKTVCDTWNSALLMRQQDNKKFSESMSPNGTKLKLSDEELLKRYEDHVYGKKHDKKKGKHRGNVEKNVDSPVSNLPMKSKNRKNDATRSSPSHGSKRRRSW